MRASNKASSRARCTIKWTKRKLALLSSTRWMLWCPTESKATAAGSKKFQHRENGQRERRRTANVVSPDYSLRRLSSACASEDLFERLACKLGFPGRTLRRSLVRLQKPRWLIASNPKKMWLPYVLVSKQFDLFTAFRTRSRMWQTLLVYGAWNKRRSWQQKATKAKSRCPCCWPPLPSRVVPSLRNFFCSFSRLTLLFSL